MKRLLMLAIVLMSVLTFVPVAQADDVIHTRIFDQTLGWAEVTGSPANIVVGHSYFLLADVQGPSGAGTVELDMGATTPYWTFTGQGHTDFHSPSGSVSCSWVTSTKYRCVASGTDKIDQVYISANAIGATTLATMVGRSASPTGQHNRLYTIN